MADTIDSNVTGARIAEEASPGVLPGTPVWDVLEPNSYDDFGSEITTAARNPLNPSRQRKKGSVVDLDASGGFQQDFTETGLLKLMQGFLFADAHIPGDTKPVFGAAVPITSTTAGTKTYSAASGLGGFAAGDLVLMSGFAQAANNGIKTVVSSTAGTVVVSEAVGASEASPPSSARIQKVGKKAAAADLAIVIAGSQVTLTSTTLNLTTLGLVEGSWIFIGSEDNKFVNVNNRCFARADVISANAIIFGKTSKTMVAEAAGPAVDILLPVFVRNEPNPDNIKRRTYQLERTLGRDANGVMSEYLIGSMSNEFTLNLQQGELITADLAFIAQDNEQRDGLTGVKAGTRPSLATEDAYNATSDVRRSKMAIVTPGNPNPSALFGYATEFSLEINNNVSPNKAIGVLGAFSMTAGTFEVGGSAEVYFSDIAAVQAVRNNADVTQDLILVKNGSGWVFDIPLLSLGDGRLAVEQDQPIKLPLETMAAESDLGHTLMVARFPYLPSFA